MTSTTTEAVEAAAHALEQNASKWMHAHSMRNGAAMLRALAAERDALKADEKAWRIACNIAVQEKLAAEAQLATEKALADQLGQPFIYGGDVAAGVSAYRKARGL